MWGVMFIWALFNDHEWLAFWLFIAAVLEGK